MFSPKVPAPRNEIIAWDPGLPGISEVLHARWRDHAYPTHTHDTWTLLIVDDGAIGYDLDQHRDHAAFGSGVTLLPPHVPHDEHALSSRGFRQRVLYLEEELLPASLIGACVDAPALPESRASPTWPALWGSAHLVRAFTSEFTISPHGCLIGCRLDRAHRLLLAGLPVTEVAIDAGLHDQAHLTRTFGRFLLTTPGQYQHSPQHRAVHPCERHRDDQSCTRRPRRVREIIDHVTGIPDALEPPFSTKIAVIVREDLASWQRLNVTAFLSATIAAADPQLIGAPYQDGDDGTHLPLPGMPVLIFEATAETLATVRGRAVARNLDAAIHTGDMFHTGYAAANQATTATVPAAELDLVGLAVHGPENPLDRTINEARLHP